MRVIVMDTGRGTKAETVALWRERLELADGDVLSLLTWRSPIEPLPVGEHLVFGPHLDLRRREPRPAWTTAEAGSAVGGVAGPSVGDAGPAEHAPIDGDADDAGDPDGGPDGPGDTEGIEATEADVSSLGDTELSAQLSEQMTDRKDRDVSGGVGDVEGGHHAHTAVHIDDAEAPVGDPTGDAGGTADPTAVRRGPDRSLLALPVYHPRRLRQAARWRANRVRLVARRGYRAGKRYLRRSPGVTARAARRVVGVYGGGIATEFAVAAARSRGVEAVFRSADVVVPVDARSQRAAWVLARRFEGPDVVVTYPAAVRAIDARRAQDALEVS